MSSAWVCGVRGCGSREPEGGILGEMRGRRAGEMRLLVVEVEARFREPPRPLGFLEVLVKGAAGEEWRGLGVGSVAGMRGRRAGVARAEVLPCVGAMRGVLEMEADVGAGGSAAASGRRNSSMPTPRPSVVDGLAVSMPDGESVEVWAVCDLDRRMREAGVAGGGPKLAEPEWGLMEGVLLAEAGLGGGRMVISICAGGETEDG